MIHQSGHSKLNLRSSHRTALIRNQAITFITHGSLTSTKARVQEVRRFVERLVTIARVGNEFNARRRAKQLLPYKEEALIKLFLDIAPRYKERNGGYTRIIRMGQRASDTAQVARLEWV
jgi:large subunit ribosomal protein L17